MSDVPPRLPAPPRHLTDLELLTRHERHMRLTERPVGSTARKRPAGDGRFWHWFNHYGPIEVGGLDVPFVNPVDVQIIAARIDVAAGSDPGTLVIRLNGSTLATVSWTGEHHSEVQIDQPMAGDVDTLTVALTAGSGEAAVAVRCTMVPAA